MKIAKKPNNIDKERKAKIGKRRAKVNRKARYMKPFFPFSGVSISNSISSSLTSITTAVLLLLFVGRKKEDNPFFRGKVVTVGSSEYNTITLLDLYP